MSDKCWCGGPVVFNADNEDERVCMWSVFHDPDRLPSQEHQVDVNVLYLAGPMSGIPDCNYPEFNAQAERLRQAGYTVHNPAEIGDKGSQYADLLKADIAIILECEGIALLEGWWASKGAMLEVHIAGVLGYPVRPVQQWIDEVIS